MTDYSTRPGDERRVVTISNPLEDTPEGMAAMDRLRDVHEELRAEASATFGEGVLEAIDAAEAKFEAEVLGIEAGNA